MTLYKDIFESLTRDNGSYKLNYYDILYVGHMEFYLKMNVLKYRTETESSIIINFVI